MSKLCFLEKAGAKGWPMPESWLVNSEAELAGCLDQITLPCILKPAIKNHAFRLHSPKKAFKVQTREELQAVYRMVSQWEPEVLVQEWIAGGDDRVVFCLGYWNRSGKAVALFPGMKLRQWPPECGNTALSAPVSDPLRTRLTMLTGEILGSFGYRGLGSVEFKLREDGSPVIMEPTVGRTNYQNEIAVVNGVNLPAIAYFDLLGRQDMVEQLGTAKSPEKPVKLIDELADTKSARFYIGNGALTASQWRESRRGSKKDMLFRWTDPAPFLALRLRNAASFLKHGVLSRLRQRTVRGDLPPTTREDNGAT
jgi:predicted ATP-grasp superfamily ATP-dependent carboligase